MPKAPRGKSDINSVTLQYSCDKSTLWKSLYSLQKKWRFKLSVTHKAKLFSQQLTSKNYAIVFNFFLSVSCQKLILQL